MKHIKKSMFEEIIINVIFVIFVILLLFSSYELYKNLKEDKEQGKIFESLQEIVVEDLENVDNKENTEEIKDENKTRNLQELYNQNSDFVGWLQIENTNINYPVMQSKDRKNYYLKRNFYKQYSSLGTPYIAEYCDINASDNLIIYGHHIKNNTMFGELEKYKRLDFYKSHKTIKFDTLNEKAEYEIISVFKTIAINGFQYYNFYNAKNEDEFNAFVKKCKELSFYDTETKAEYGDRLITLSTCEYSQKNGRLVVVARKI